MVIVESLDINDSSGTKGRISLINNLDKCGFQLLVCHYTQKHVDLNSINLAHINCIPIPEKKWTLLYFLSRTERIFTRITKLNLNPYLENWFGFSFTFFNDSNSIATAVKKQFDFSPDFVITLSKGASFRPHHALLKLPELHDKWIAYIHDPFPYHFYPRPYNWIQPGYAQKEFFFNNVSKKAKYSAFPSLLLKDWMGSYFINFDKTGIVIPHQIKNMNVVSTNLPSYFKSDKFTLLHAGNLMRQRNPVALIEAYKNFINSNPEAAAESQLLILGKSSYFEKELKSYQKELENLIVINKNIAFDEVLQLQFAVSVNIILESISEISPFLPGKFPHCIAANKPILLLSPYYSETKRLLGDNYEFWSEASDVKKITKHIQIMFQNWKNNSNIKLNRPDLEYYLDIDNLKIIIQNLSA